MSVVQIAQNVWTDLASHASQGYPEEICGFLYGKEQENHRGITHLLAVENKSHGQRKRRFEITPHDYMKGERYALQIEQDLLGIYHTHPDHPALPSRHDHAQAMPYFSYLILSVSHGVIKRSTSWQLDDQRKFQREAVYILD
jgi:proteasome lid subunit RPN8/RPN11